MKFTTDPFGRGRLRAVFFTAPIRKTRDITTPIRRHAFLVCSPPHRPPPPPPRSVEGGVCVKTKLNKRRPRPHPADVPSVFHCRRRYPRNNRIRASTQTMREAEEKGRVETRGGGGREKKNERITHKRFDTTAERVARHGTYVLFAFIAPFTQHVSYRFGVIIVTRVPCAIQERGTRIMPSISSVRSTFVSRAIRQRVCRANANLALMRRVCRMPCLPHGPVLVP